MNEDNARFCLLAGLILLYLLCGAAIFSALEHPFELRARRLWKQQLDNFTKQYRVNLGALHTLLRQYEEANGAGIRVDTLRPRWDFSGAFYFVGTVVSTIGKSSRYPVLPKHHRYGCRGSLMSLLNKIQTQKHCFTIHVTCKMSA